MDRAIAGGSIEPRFYLCNIQMFFVFLGVKNRLEPEVKNSTFQYVQEYAK